MERWQPSPLPMQHHPSLCWRMDTLGIVFMTVSIDTAVCGTDCPPGGHPVTSTAPFEGASKLINLHYAHHFYGPVHTCD